MVSLEPERLTEQKFSRSDSVESHAHPPPLVVEGSERPEARIDCHRSEGRKQISVGEHTVEVFPTISIKTLQLRGGSHV